MAELTKPMEWSSEGVEPSETLKKTGFKGGYKPPAEIFNYFLHNSEVCITELQKETTNAQSTANAAKTVAENAQITAGNAVTAVKKLKTDSERIYATKEEISDFVTNEALQNAIAENKIQYACGKEESFTATGTPPHVVEIGFMPTLLKIYNADGLLGALYYNGNILKSTCAYGSNCGFTLNAVQNNEMLMTGYESGEFYWEAWK